MSTPSSLLSKYRSYNYRHVLVMCDSTETATMMLGNTDEGIWAHPEATGKDPLGRFAPVDLGSDHKYCVLIDGATDATFVINQTRWFAATAASATNADKMTSTAVEGSMDIKMVVTKRYAGRPDLVAYDVYGRTTLMWVVLQYNTILDITEDFVEGTQITLPTRSRLFSELLTGKASAVFA